MAANFKITIYPNGDTLQLKLRGDFDGISAHELISMLNQCRHHPSRIYIHTNSLREIHAFGLAVFQDKLKTLNGRSLELVFTGEHASLFAAAAPVGTDLLITQSEVAG
jgi:anti-anti-sigma regulatory factor